MFNIENVRDCKWVDAEHTRIDCMVKYEQFEEEHPSTIDPNDKYEHTKLIWENALKGEYGPIQEYTPPEAPIETPAELSLEDLLKTL